MPITLSSMARSDRWPEKRRSKPPQVKPSASSSATEVPILSRPSTWSARSSTAFIRKVERSFRRTSRPPSCPPVDRPSVNSSWIRRVISSLSTTRSSAPSTRVRLVSSMPTAKTTCLSSPARKRTRFTSPKVAQSRRCPAKPRPPR